MPSIPTHSFAWVTLGMGCSVTWAAVALSDDLPLGMAMPCRLEGRDLAVWRSASGQAFVWGDRCPHRGMRLSQGFVRGEALSCIYHGWRYGHDGGCVYIPAHPDLVPPKSICATTYKCGEADGLIWAALEETTETIPPVPTGIPVRSMQVDAAISQVALHFGAPGETLITLQNQHPVTIALQPVDDTCTAMHISTTERHHRKAVSRWLEQQRAEIESAAA